MSESERGWTREFPQVEGLYWARRTQTNAPGLTIIQVWQDESEWYAYRFANQNDIEAEDFVRSLYEFLGPISPSDFEQLAALRIVTVDAVEWISNFKELDHNMFHTPKCGAFEFCNEETCREAKRLIAALREALNPELAQRKGEKS